MDALIKRRIKKRYRRYFIRNRKLDMPRNYQDAILKDEKSRVLQGNFIEYFRKKGTILSEERLDELENELLMYLSELDKEFINDYYNHPKLFKLKVLAEKVLW